MCISAPCALCSHLRTARTPLQVGAHFTRLRRSANPALPRLRLVSIACRPFYTFSIDNHEFTAIELDGVAHDPVVAQNVDVYAGQIVYHIPLLLLKHPQPNVSRSFYMLTNLLVIIGFVLRE